MAKQIQAIRGMNDCLPEQSPVWQKVEQILRHVNTREKEVKFGRIIGIFDPEVKSGARMRDVKSTT